MPSPWRSGAILLASGLPLIVLGAFDVETNYALLLLAFAMGLQGGSVARFADINVQTVVITGTILKLAEAAVYRLIPGRGDRRSPPPLQALPVFWSSWLSYAAGGALSVAAQPLGALKLLLPLLILLPVALSEDRDS